LKSKDLKCFFFVSCFRVKCEARCIQQMELHISIIIIIIITLSEIIYKTKNAMKKSLSYISKITYFCSVAFLTHEDSRLAVRSILVLFSQLCARNKKQHFFLLVGNFNKFIFNSSSLISEMLTKKPRNII
jgi:hypothetical protein